MRVLGLDPGSRRTGFGVVERNGNRLRCLDHGTRRRRRALDLAAAPRTPSPSASAR